MSIQISTRIDEETKLQFDKVCERIGVSTSNALSMFIKGVINYNGIPFNVIAPSEKVAENAKEYTPNNTVRPSFEYGSMFGKIWMADDFDAPLDD